MVSKAPFRVPLAATRQLLVVAGALVSPHSHRGDRDIFAKTPMSNRVGGMIISKKEKENVEVWIS